VNAPLPQADESPQAAEAASADAAGAQSFTLRCADGRGLAAHWIRAARRRAVLVINPATGFPQTFYFRLANYAAGRGYDTLVYDYRGMGASAPSDLAAETCRMSDWGLQDMRAALSVAAAQAGGAPLATLGHSVGGQFLGLLANHALARVHVQVATSAETFGAMYQFFNGRALATTSERPLHPLVLRWAEGRSGRAQWKGAALRAH